MSKIFLREFASSNTEAISIFVAGARMILRHVSGNDSDPMEIDEVKQNGMTSIFLVYGEWISAEQANFPDHEHLNYGGQLPDIRLYAD